MRCTPDPSVRRLTRARTVSTFGIDRTAPGTPTVVTPTAGVLITGPVISLVWIAPPDTGSPLAYDVAVDSMVRRFDGVARCCATVARCARVAREGRGCSGE